MGFRYFIITLNIKQNYSWKVLRLNIAYCVGRSKEFHKLLTNTKFSEVFSHERNPLYCSHYPWFVVVVKTKSACQHQFSRSKLERKELQVRIPIYIYQHSQCTARITSASKTQCHYLTCKQGVMLPISYVMFHYFINFPRILCTTARKALCKHAPIS